ncbi:MAG: 23S rRNA (adenine(2503)-C(2))-methyltransferase RlmN [Candidatus Eremiobacteraeota bacterium]|nr:23S rRNA (adenine(2503)-C(2))-methyltransferase RlmN [Candidatus Eremiobacteraeota bacterium]
MEMINLKGKTQEELDEFAKSIGESAFRGRQLFKWIYHRGESDFDKMTDIGKELKKKLRETSHVSVIKLVDRVTADDKNTEKFLFQLADGNLIESVLMRYEEHLGFGRCTVCISSQVGCAQGCTFCASGKNGLVRSLTVSEIVDQVMQVQSSMNDTAERVTNVVVMGIGEPLANFKNVVKAIGLINHGDGIAIGMRHIAVSTVGIPRMMKKLADEKLSIRFAVSLHAPDNETRSKIIPANRKYPVESIIDASKYYQKVTGRRITFEYMLIDGLNDSLDQAKMLGKLLRGIHAMINLIPLNPVKESPYKRPARNRCYQFAKEVEKFGHKVIFRNERGTSIDAACGQLRNRMTEKEKGS